MSCSKYAITISSSIFQISRWRLCREISVNRLYVTGYVLGMLSPAYFKKDSPFGRESWENISSAALTGPLRSTNAFHFHLLYSYNPVERILLSQTWSVSVVVYGFLTDHKCLHSYLTFQTVSHEYNTMVYSRLGLPPRCVAKLRHENRKAILFILLLSLPQYFQTQHPPMASESAS